MGAQTYLSLPGVSGAYASTPDTAALDIVADIDIRADIAATDWTPAAVQSIVCKSVAAGNQRSWRLDLATTGRPSFLWYPDGSTQTTVNASAAPTVANGERYALRVTFDVDNGAGQNVATFYTAPTLAGPWVQLGAPVTTAGVASLHSGTAPVEIGSLNNGTAQPFAGKVYGVEIRNGIDGTLVCSPDFRVQTPGARSFTDTTGRAVTVNGTAALLSEGPSLTPQQVGIAGPAVSLAAARSVENVDPDPRGFLWVKNTNAATRTVTVGVPGVEYGQQRPDVPVVVPVTTGERLIGPLDGGLAHGATGLVTVTVDPVADLTIAAVRI